MKLTGTVRRSDLEGGLYQLHADDGVIYELDHQLDDALLRRDGARVEIDGTIDKQAVSFTMTGPRLRVRAVRAA
jgi:hypothetical protein